jgi:hypothetical protein
MRDERWPEKLTGGRVGRRQVLTSKILEKQDQAEALLEGKTYISDRGIDNLAYTKKYCGDDVYRKFLNSDPAQRCISRFEGKEFDSLLF